MQQICANKHAKIALFVQICQISAIFGQIVCLFCYLCRRKPTRAVVAAFAWWEAATPLSGGRVSFC